MTGQPTFNAHESVPFADRPKVAICLPMAEKVDAEFSLAFASLTYATRYPLALIRGASSMGAFEARNHCMDSLETLERQTKTRYDWTFWLDSDMIFPPDSLTGLMSRERDIVGAGYVRRVPPHNLLVRPLPEDQGIDVRGGLKEVRGLPGGCVLIRRSLFDELETPAWRVALRTDVTQGHGGRHIGEDYAIFDALRAKGHKVWLDVDLTKVVGHIGSATHYVPKDVEEAVLASPPPPTRKGAPTIIGLRGNGRT